MPALAKPARSSRCDNCVFWLYEGERSEADPDEDGGECRRRAPKPIDEEFNFQIMSFLSTIAWRFADEAQKANDFKRWEETHMETVVWPRTLARDWCGDGEKREEIDASPH